VIKEKKYFILTGVKAALSLGDPPFFVVLVADAPMTV
jgi:hypothetical protein